MSNEKLSSEEASALQEAGFKLKQKPLEDRAIEALESIASSLKLLVIAIGDQDDVERCGSVVLNLDAIYGRVDRS